MFDFVIISLKLSKKVIFQILVLFNNNLISQTITKKHIKTFRSFSCLTYKSFFEKSMCDLMPTVYFVVLLKRFIVVLKIIIN